MKINYRRKSPKRRRPVAPPGFRHTDKKHEQSKKACRRKSEDQIGLGYLPLYGADLD